MRGPRHVCTTYLNLLVHVPIKLLSQLLRLGLDALNVGLASEKVVLVASAVVALEDALDDRGIVVEHTLLL